MLKSNDFLRPRFNKRSSQLGSPDQPSHRMSSYMSKSKAIVDIVYSTNTTWADN